MTSELPLRERKKAQTRQRLRDVAHELFAEHGYDGTTVAAIAAAAEVSEPTFFRYYPSKASVAAAPLDDIVEALIDAFAAQPAELSPIEACIAATHDYERIAPAFRPAATQQLRQVIDGKGFAFGLIEVFDSGRLSFAEEVGRRAGIDAGSVEATQTATLVGGIVFAALRSWLGDPDSNDPVAMARDGFELLRRGLA